MAVLKGRELTMDEDFIREVEMKGLLLGADLPAQKVYKEIAKTSEILREEKQNGSQKTGCINSVSTWVRKHTIS
jgi:hypothetical protein